ncbi:MFS transporter [Deinococcus cellulosilyticus]|uniref:Nitrite extrusion protein 1 n=1 Tax=Deinococcus cellulosilyticus (strain DSM 18568 / NBRC 106333 / KACC 11606 / 5516J-15) TaxID=1223518 RepID=A0A511N9Q3_DEIC1|nr:nitrate/nitrite transporter [Deinococcus cellulosilyticus]GEM49562.1 nitrite extrusion protein 1 [Deinococcus cellulosilyticus NBRC 106333 = KACC 11606]
MQSASIHKAQERNEATRVLWLSTLGFTLMFAVWLMFGVLGIPIRKELGLTDLQMSWLTSVAVLNGAIWRLNFGILTDRLGGRKVFTALLLFTAIPAALVAYTHSYTMLLILAFMVGMAGNSFSVGIAWNSAWNSKEHQGFALGVFGAGNVGASVTKLIAPTLIAMLPVAGFLGGVIPGGWRFIPIMYAVLLVIMALCMWFYGPKEDRLPGQGRPMAEILKPLREIRVWRFSLYYVVVFGAYVALSAWLPKYYVDVFGLELKNAALLTALFIFPASLLRPLGGFLSDKFGPRVVMKLMFALIFIPSVVLSIPALGLSVGTFTALLFVMAVGMGIGKAAVYKYIPQYYPKDVGAVGGLVGLFGALGGFVLPPLFAVSQSLIGLPEATFMVMSAITLLAALWLAAVLNKMHALP